MDRLLFLTFRRTTSMSPLHSAREPVDFPLDQHLESFGETRIKECRDNGSEARVTRLPADPRKLFAALLQRCPDRLDCEKQRLDTILPMGVLGLATSQADDLVWTFPVFTSCCSSWGGQRPSLADYVMVTGGRDGATATGGCLKLPTLPVSGQRAPLALFSVWRDR